MRCAGKATCRIVCSVIALLCLLHAQAAPAQPDLRGGLWEISTRTEMAGKPDDALAPAVRTLCLTDSSNLPAVLQQGRDCRITDEQTQGNTVSWKMTCPGPDRLVTGSGTLTSGGDRFEGLIRIRVRHTNLAPVDLRQHIRGQRKGECLL